MATLTTQNTWHGNPRGTVAYADTAYVNSVTSPYIHIPSGGSASTVPTYVSRQGPATMVLTAEIPLLNDLNIPFTTNNGLYSSIPLLPTGGRKEQHLNLMLKILNPLLTKLTH